MPEEPVPEHPDGEPGLNNLCAGYQHLFNHIAEPMQMMCDLLRRGRAPAELPSPPARRGEERYADADRNDPCRSGSGARFTRCHGTVDVGAAPDRDEGESAPN